MNEFGFVAEALLTKPLFLQLNLVVLALLRSCYFSKKSRYNDWNVGWLQFIYSDRNVDVLHNSDHINRQHQNAYLPPCLHKQTQQITNRIVEQNNVSLYLTTRNENKMKEEHQEKLSNVGKHRYWIWDYIFIKDKDIYDHRGNDAFQYLLFQRYLIYYLTALTAVCMLIVLPVNIFGKNGENGYFSMTTINNIVEDSNIFWIHLVVTVALVVLVSSLASTICVF